MVYELVDQGIGVVWSTAYLDEAERCAEVLLHQRGPDPLRRPAAGAHRPRRGADLPGRRGGRVAAAGPDRGAAAPRGHRRRDPGEQRPAGDRRRCEPAGCRDARGRRARDPAGRRPRFEDAFIDLLGGGPKGESPLAGRPARRRRRTGRSSRPRADQAVRRLHRRRPDHLPHRPGRDLRPARPQRRRQVDHVQDDVRPAAPHVRHGPRGGARPVPRRRPPPARGWATWPRSSRSTAI